MLCYRTAFEVDDPEASKQYKSIHGFASMPSKQEYYSKQILPARWDFFYYLLYVEINFWKFYVSEVKDIWSFSC